MGNVNINREEVKNIGTNVTLVLSEDEFKAVMMLLGKSNGRYRAAVGIINTMHLYAKMVEVVKQIDPDFDWRAGLEFNLNDEDV